MGIGGPSVAERGFFFSLEHLSSKNDISIFFVIIGISLVLCHMLTVCHVPAISSKYFRSYVDLIDKSQPGTNPRGVGIFAYS